MTNQGFVKIPRKLLNWRWYGNRNVRLVFLDLLIRAAWGDVDFLGVMLHRGQVAVSIGELATSNQLTVQQTRTALNNLKSTGDITTESTSKFTIITLNFYDELLGINKPDNEQLTSDYSQTQQAPTENFNNPTYYNNKKEIIIKEKELPAARGINKKNFSKKTCTPSSNSSFNVDEVVERIKARRRNSDV